MSDSFLTACELKRKVPVFARATGLVLALSFFSTISVLGQPAHSAPAAAESAEHAVDGEHAAEHSITDMVLGLGWPIANFIIFVGVIYYYGSGPMREHLAMRSATIRKDLVEAAALQATAREQLATIEQKLQALPGELNALRARGADEIAAEEKRIAAAAEADRERLVEQTRRTIELQVRLARKDILDHAADLSLQLATQRIKKEMTPADQDRLVGRYFDQVRHLTQAKG